MPTETQHLEQRVAALQSDLNTKDEQIDALTFSDNDRELSRRDWFEAAQEAEKRVEELTKAFRKLRDVVRGCERLASSYSPCLDSVDENGGDDHEDPTCAIFHRLYYAMFDAEAALSASAERSAPVAVVHPFTEKVIRKLERFQEYADDGQGADIGRHWFGLLTQLGLLNRVQRSPALWEMTQQGEDALELSRQSAKSR